MVYIKLTDQVDVVTRFFEHEMVPFKTFSIGQSDTDEEGLYDEEKGKKGGKIKIHSNLCSDN